jgi:hypothetical protein
MELVPDDIHAKCPDYLGQARMSSRCMDQYAKAGVDVPKL